MNSHLKLSFLPRTVEHEAARVDGLLQVLAEVGGQGTRLGKRGHVLGLLAVRHTNSGAFDLIFGKASLPERLKDGGALAERVLGRPAQPAGAAWDAALEEIDLDATSEEVPMPTSPTDPPPDLAEEPGEDELAPEPEAPELDEPKVSEPEAPEPEPETPVAEP